MNLARKQIADDFQASWGGGKPEGQWPLALYDKQVGSRLCNKNGTVIRGEFSRGTIRGNPM